MTKTVLHYEEEGDGQEGVLVLLHGFMGNSRSLRPLMTPLSRGRRCVAFDLPGHGRSRFGPNERLQGIRTMDAAAALVLEDLEVLGIGRFNLYGYSMGGRVAQNMALLAPGRIERLILESASFGIDDPKKWKERYLRDQQLFAATRSKKEFALFLDDWHRLPLFRTLQETPLLPQIIQEKEENSIEELQRALGILGVGSHPFFAKRLAGLGIPIHFFCGEKDDAYVETGRKIRRWLPELTIREFPGASHDIHSQFPAAVAEAILEIIAPGEARG